VKLVSWMQLVSFLHWTCTASQDGPIRCISHLTPSQRVFLSRPICLIPPAFNVVQRLTAAVSVIYTFHVSAAICYEMTGSSPINSCLCIFLPFFQRNSASLRSRSSPHRAQVTVAQKLLRVVRLL